MGNCFKLFIYFKDRKELNLKMYDPQQKNIYLYLLNNYIYYILYKYKLYNIVLKFLYFYIIKIF